MKASGVCGVDRNEGIKQVGKKESLRNQFCNLLVCKLFVPKMRLSYDPLIVALLKLCLLYTSPSPRDRG
eukprot:906177-Amphidinium_carterae.1